MILDFPGPSVTSLNSLSGGVFLYSLWYGSGFWEGYQPTISFEGEPGQESNAAN